jgi:tRNA-dihydrouridine synthase B
MIGRAAIGQPWLLGQIATFLKMVYGLRRLMRRNKMRFFESWYHDCLALYGESLGVRVGRKHIAGFIEAFLGAARGTPR